VPLLADKCVKCMFLLQNRKSWVIADPLASNENSFLAEYPPK